MEIRGRLPALDEALGMPKITYAEPAPAPEQARLILIAHQVVVRIDPAAIPAERDDLGVLADSTPGLAEHPADEGGNRWGDLHSINPVLVVRPKS